MHTVNLALRFALEVVALFGFGLLAWSLFDGAWRLAAVLITVATVMAFWGLFTVPGDPSRSGSAPIPVAGRTRLGLELAILFGGAAAFWIAGALYAGGLLALMVVLHYAMPPSRAAWLLRQ